MVAIEQSSVLALKTDGSIWSWGYNLSGELGLGDSGLGTERSSPVRVGANTDWKMVFKGYQSTQAIKNDGTLWTWGNNATGQLGLGDTTSRSSPVKVGANTDWKMVCNGGSSNDYMVGIKRDGTLWSCGYNTNGNLGDGTTVGKSTPIQVGTLTNWKQVTNGLAIKTDGTLWAWGLNSSGRLGLGDTTNRSSPTQVGTLNNWIKVVRANETVAIRLETGQ
jgi:alpha-tubulin suppressor-like RCC1 family protein